MKSFQEILEKRVRNSTKDDLDFYTIEKAVKKIIKDVFGKRGEQDIYVKNWKDGKLILSAEKSLWKSELVLNRNFILSKLNKLLNTKAIKKIVIV